MGDTYKAVYRCRLCKRIHGNGFRTGESVAVKTLHLMLAGLDYQPKHWVNALPKEIVHHCHDGTMGISDFVGFSKYV